jgi:MFS family permease
MFLCVFTIPLYFQYARGASAVQSGAYIAPFMVAMAMGNVVASRWTRRVGTVRGALLVGSGVACLGLALMATISPIAPAWAIVAVMIVIGPGIGCCFISSMIGAQNALGPRDIGTGTGALLLLRSVGGASGSTLAGAIIAAGRSATAAHQAQGFAMVFALGAAFAAVAFVVALRMRNTSLRESLHTTPAAE